MHAQHDADRTHSSKIWKETTTSSVSGSSIASVVKLSVPADGSVGVKADASAVIATSPKQRKAIAAASSHDMSPSSVRTAARYGCHTGPLPHSQGGVGGVEGLCGSVSSSRDENWTDGPTTSEPSHGHLPHGSTHMLRSHTAESEDLHAAQGHGLSSQGVGSPDSRGSDTRHLAMPASPAQRVSYDATTGGDAASGSGSLPAADWKHTSVWGALLQGEGRSKALDDPKARVQTLPQSHSPLKNASGLGTQPPRKGERAAHK